LVLLKKIQGVSVLFNLDHITILKKIDAKWYDYIDFIELILCKRCWRETHALGPPYHHHGGIFYLLSQEPKISDQELTLWENDLEHGLLHGLIVGFFAFLLNDQKAMINSVCEDGSPYTLARKGNKVTKNYLQKPLNYERGFLSWLFHDFMRSQNIHKDHDIFLREKFDFFDETTYHHSNPLAEEEGNHPLIAADRLELMRYNNYTEWCNLTLLQPYIKKIGKAFIEIFYTNFRPALYKIIKNRLDIWLSHVVEPPIESNYVFTHQDMYPKHHWCAIDPGLEQYQTTETNQYFSVNVGKLPFERCLAHTKKGLTGLISLPALKTNNASIKSAPLSTWGRDHPFIFKNKDIPASEWLFVYHQNSDLNHYNSKTYLMHAQTLNRTCKVIEDLLCKIKILKTN
jgi:hypothetical protein